MAESNPKILAMVERALKKNPALASTELHQRAQRIDKSIAGLSGRQFHARYALAARKRLAGGGSRRRRKPGRPKGSGRKPGRPKGSGRKPGRPRGTGARRGRPPKSASGPAITMLSESYEQQKAALNDALDSAFQKAVRADSVQRINELLTDVEHTVSKYGGR